MTAIMWRSVKIAPYVQFQLDIVYSRERKGMPAPGIPFLFYTFIICYFYSEQFQSNLYYLLMPNFSRR